MKKQLLVLILSLLISGLSAQVAHTPSDYILCDDGFNDGSAEFDLTQKDAEILQGQDPVNFMVGYYLSEIDALNNTNQLASPFTNFTNPQTIFASVIENSTGNFDITNFDLIVNPGPVITQQVELNACSFDGNGIAEFDLTQATQVIIGAQTEISLTYHETQADAESALNPITNLNSYYNTIPNYQVLYVRVESNVTGCFTLSYLNLFVSGVAPIPTISDYVVCDDDQDGFAEFNLQTKDDEVLINQDNFELFVSYHLSEADAINQTNPLPYIYTNISNPQTVYAAVSDYFGCNTEIRSFNLVADQTCMPCQDITLTIENTIPEINNSGIVVAQVNDDVNFFGNAVFSNDSTDATYSWDFGDGNVGTGLSVIHQFLEEGSYTVTLTATDTNPEGCSESISIEVIILGEFLSVDTSQFTVEELVQNILINNDCSQVSNITYSTGTAFGSQEPNGIAYFVYEGNNFPFSEGLLISTGEAADIEGPNDSNLSSGTNNWSGDVDLDTALGVQSNNATIIEFDFVPVVNAINFDFLMASEEYNGDSFECTFSDAFAFLLTDAAGNTTNLALIPGTDLPITVTNIHNANGSCDAANPEFFAGYTPEGAPPFEFNGRTVNFTAEANVNIGETYHIKLVIADDGDSAFDSAVFLKAGSFDIGSLCEDTGLITMKAFNDTNTNGDFDDGESNFTNGSFTYEKNDDGVINVVNSSNGSFTILSTDENDTYDVTFTVNPDFTGCYSQDITVFNDISVAFGELAQVQFPVEDNLTCEDLGVYLINPSASPRPGFEHTNLLIIENLSGTEIASGSVEFTLDDDLQMNNAIASDTSMNITTTATGMTVDFTNLGAGESEMVVITLLCPTTVSLGEVVTNSVIYTTDSNDIFVENNSSQLAETVIGAYDPNDKMEAHGPQILYNDFVASNEYLFYTIRFQNIGTAEAINVRIEDVLDSQLDASTFQMLRSSHDYVVTRTANSLEWNFQNINLPAEQDDAEGSNGYVYFKVKPNPGYAVGDIIENSAAIYFDFNDPIITNTFQTEFVETLSVDTFETVDFTLFPNPAKDEVKIQLSNTNFGTGKINIYNIQGKVILKDIKFSENSSTLNISNIESGLYFVELTLGNRAMVQKLIVN
ncbi:DUF7619 domain-containing protein [Winogradskyella schleiferi]|uniref:DUF7619 domain-containing protein n=1 Tax=Winogradskyella schleiferi TaxID=2686078 RepID=UPI0015C0DE94|nr:choice-of-anchor L domain-containing protein [Winogradskyella schleiferi]